VSALPQRRWGDTLSSRRALLVHGLSSDSGSWWHVAEELALDGWHVTAVDLRGHGGAPRETRYRLTDYAGDLPGDAWNLVVGHSLGGAVSVLAAQRAGFTTRLVLLDPLLDVPEEQAEAIIADQVAELDYTAESIAHDRPHWHELDRASKLAGVQRVHAAAVVQTFTDTGRWDVTAEAAALRIPTLILAGDPAVYTMLHPSTVESIANPLIEYRVIEGAGHSPHRDSPRETIAAILNWLVEH
jgi:pimeloyl-ACP methyl ester carboxylesterase